MFATAATGARVVPLKVLDLSKRFGSRVALSWRDWRRGDWRRRAPPGINRTTYAPRPRHTLVLPVPDGDTHYLLLLYDYVGDVLERRAPYREEHLERIRAGRDAGEIVMAGPLGDPPRGAAIVFKGIDEEAVQRFARQDPYVQAGLVPSWRAARWSVL